MSNLHFTCYPSLVTRPFLAVYNMLSHWDFEKHLNRRIIKPIKDKLTLLNRFQCYLVPYKRLVWVITYNALWG